MTDSDVSVSTSEGTKYHTVGYFNIGFSGSIIPTKENLLEFVMVLNELTVKGYKIKFNMCGSIKEDDHMLLKNVEKLKGTLAYYGRLNKNELSDFLSQQDLLVIPRGYNLQNKYGFSTKLSDYLNHQKIILLTDISDNKLFIKDGINGFMVPPDNTQVMLNKIEYIINNFSELEKVIIPKAKELSKSAFDYRNFRIPLRHFVTNNLT